MDRLETMIAHHEGLKFKPYRCPAGKLTIGYGRNLEAKGVSQKVSLLMMQEDIAESIQELTSFPWFVGLSEARRAALIDMNFNLGFPRFRQFRKMLAAIQRNDFDTAAAEMLNSKWARQVGTRALELATMMRTGAWQ